MSRTATCNATRALYCRLMQNSVFSVTQNELNDSKGQENIHYTKVAYVAWNFYFTADTPVLILFSFFLSSDRSAAVFLIRIQFLYFFDQLSRK